MAIKILKVFKKHTYTDMWQEEDFSLYEDKAFTKLSFIRRVYFHKEGAPVEISIVFKLLAGKRELERNHTLKIPAKNCIIEKYKDSRGSDMYYIKIPSQAWQDAMLPFIARYIKKACLQESELMDLVDDWLNLEYDKYHLREQVEIGGRIADGLAFADKNILAFEVKADTDNYKRLEGQCDAYHLIADEVYLVVENKEPPEDLPWYIGVLKVEDGALHRTRVPTTLKHSYYARELWSTMMGNVKQHVFPGKVPRGTVRKHRDLFHIFDAIEVIKKKLLYNQFVVGFHQSYVDKYLALTNREKNIIKQLLTKRTITQEELGCEMKLSEISSDQNLK